MKARFGRYVFLKKIAVGGMAEIFLARRLSFGGFAKFVVIKRLLPEHRGRGAYERLFLAEARTQAQLHHPNIVSLHDLGKLDDAYFIAMEYVHGISGAELMAKAAHVHRPVPLGVALRIVAGIADALHYCHAALDLEGGALGVLHHDVSPHNVQISFDGDVKLLDFGVCTRLGQPAAGGRRGKFAYMSPEAIDTGELDARSDVYSLGVVLYELTTGRRLYKGVNREETLERATAAVVPSPTKLDEYYPPSLEEVVYAALARDRASRFSDAMAFGAALAGVARKLGVDTGPDALSRYLSELYEDDIGRRRDELHRLAQAADPRHAKREGPGATPPMLQEAAASVELPVADETDDHPATPTPSLPPELSTDDSSPVDEPSESDAAQDDEAPATELVGPEVNVPAGFELPPGANDADEPDWDAALAAPLSAQRRWTLFMAALAVALGIGGFLGGRVAAEKEAGKRAGVLHIESDPPGARVYDGSRLLGMTPFDMAPATAGKMYQLRMQRRGYRTWSGSVSVLANRPDRSVLVTLVKDD